MKDMMDGESPTHAGAVINVSFFCVLMLKFFFSSNFKSCKEFVEQDKVFSAVYLNRSAVLVSPTHGTGERLRI